MANTKNAQKADRQAKKRREHNRYFGKTTRNAVRDLRAVTTVEEGKKLLPETVAMIDKLAKRNIIHKKKADNLKSGLMKKLNRIK
ncbi:MAG: 30S ribosomal protein S20 [Chitinophagaceae bacterium]|nr:30S ribosomal protein S20 [Chitinophagaceae bacterium]